MVVVNKSQFQPGAAISGGATLDAKYKVYKHKRKEDDFSNTAVKATDSIVYKYTNMFKMINWILSIILLTMAIVASILTLSKKFSDKRFPVSIVTYSVTPWNEFNSLDQKLGTFTQTGRADGWNVQQLWAWAKCDKYLTSNPVPKKDDKLNISAISAENTAWIPGGCNCIAQVGNALGGNWVYSSTNPSVDEVKEMIYFCVHEGGMPNNIAINSRSERTLFFLYAFIFCSAGSIFISNWMHGIFVWSMKEDDSKISGNHYFNSLPLDVQLLLAVVLTLGPIVAIGTSLLAHCDTCSPSLNVPEISYPTVFIVLSFIVIAYYISRYYYFRNHYNSISTALQYMAQSESSLEVNEFEFSKSNNENYGPYGETVYTGETHDHVDALNTQAQMEQLWNDTLMIPAFTILSVGICSMRAWVDIDMVAYYAALVFFYTSISAASSWVTAHWARTSSYNEHKNGRPDEETEKQINDYYQGYKNMVFFAQIFILVALIFTALPVNPVTHYFYLGFYAWFSFVLMLGVIYILPEMVNEVKALNIHTITALKQLLVIILMFCFVILIYNSEVLNKDVVL